jgi:hypothetical protein
MTSTEAVDCTNLAGGCVIDVETKSRHYLIECLGGNSIRISGHPEYCPEPVAARLHGSIDSQGGLDFGIISRGHSFRFLVNEHRPITTSRVVRLRVNQPKHNPTSTIH